jgi:hypothetical protein
MDCSRFALSWAAKGESPLPLPLPLPLPRSRTRAWWQRRRLDDEDGRLNEAAFPEPESGPAGHPFFYWCFHRPGRWCDKVCPVCDLAGLLREIAKAKGRFGLPGDAAVVSCYEAGRDGF